MSPAARHPARVVPEDAGAGTGPVPHFVAMGSSGKSPDPFLAEIQGQPQAIRAAGAGFAVQAQLLGKLHKARHRDIVFTGMGASYDACYPAINHLAANARTALHVDASELLHFRRASLGRGSLVVAVSQSGESAETVKLASTLRHLPHAPFIVSVTNGTDNHLAGLSDVAFDTRAGAESGPSTMTFVASIVVLAGVARGLTGEDPHSAVAAVDVAARRAAGRVERLLEDPWGLAEDLGSWFGNREKLVVLARGPARAAAEMGALAIKEASGLNAEALETAQFRHGPLEMADRSLAALILATEPETRRLDLALARELVSAGAEVLVVVGSPAITPPGARIMVTGRIERTVGPVVSIVPLQLLAWYLAGARGRQPGTFEVASKVTRHE